MMGFPHAKLGMPEDVASVAAYLASPESHFITGEIDVLCSYRVDRKSLIGQTIAVDGGIIFN